MGCIRAAPVAGAEGPVAVAPTAGAVAAATAPAEAATPAFCSVAGLVSVVFVGACGAAVAW